VCLCSHTRRLFGGDPGGESSSVNVLAGEGLTTFRAAALSDLSKASLRRAHLVRIVRNYECRTHADGVKATVRGEATAECSRGARRGTEGGTEGTDTQRKVGNLCLPKRVVVALPRATWTKKISRWLVGRVSDEGIVSDDTAGQHNPRESQGPLDWHVLFPNGEPLDPQRVHNGRAEQTARNTQRHDLWEEDMTCAAYKGGGTERMRTTRLNSVKRPKVAVDGQFEAVLGKTHRTEF